MKIVKSIIATIAAIALLAWLLPNVAYSSSVTLILAGLVLALLQKIVKPILNVLFLPINIVTLGIFSTIINVFIIWLATYLFPGFVISPVVILGVHLNQFFSLLLVSILISFAQSLLAIIL